MDSPLRFQQPPSPPPAARAHGYVFDEENSAKQWGKREVEYFEPSNCSDEDASNALEQRRGDLATSQERMRNTARPSSPGLSSIGDGDVSIVDASGEDGFEGGQEGEEEGVELAEGNADADYAPRLEVDAVATAMAAPINADGKAVDEARTPAVARGMHSLGLGGSKEDDEDEDEAAGLDELPSFPVLSTTAVLELSPSPSTSTSSGNLGTKGPDTCDGARSAEKTNASAVGPEETTEGTTAANATAAPAVTVTGDEQNELVTLSGGQALASWVQQDAHDNKQAEEEGEQEQEQEVASPRRAMTRKPLLRPHGSLRGGARRIAVATVTGGGSHSTKAASAVIVGANASADFQQHEEQKQQEEQQQFLTPQKDVSGAAGRTSDSLFSSSSSSSSSSSVRRHGQRLRFAESENTILENMGTPGAASSRPAPAPARTTSSSSIGTPPRPPLPPSPLHAPKHVTPKHPSSSSAPLLASHGKKKASTKSFLPRAATASAVAAPNTTISGSSAAAAIDLDCIASSSSEAPNQNTATSTSRAPPQKKQLHHHQHHQQLHPSPRPPPPPRSHAKPSRCDPVALFHALQQQRQKDQRAALKHAKIVMAAREGLSAALGSSSTSAAAAATSASANSAASAAATSASANSAASAATTSASANSAAGAATTTAAAAAAVPQMSAWARGSAVSVPIGPDGFACSQGQWESRLRRLGNGKNTAKGQRQQQQHSGRSRKSPVPSAATAAAAGVSPAPADAAPPLVFSSPNIAPIELFSNRYPSRRVTVNEELLNEARSPMKRLVHHKAATAGGVGGGDGTPTKLRQAWH